MSSCGYTFIFYQNSKTCHVILLLVFSSLLGTSNRYLASLLGGNEKIDAVNTKSFNCFQSQLTLEM